MIEPTQARDDTTEENMNESGRHLIDESAATRHTVNADLPPPLRHSPNNFLMHEDTELPLLDDVREKLRTLSNLVQEKLVAARYQLKERRGSDHLPYNLGTQLDELAIDYLKNQIRIIEDYHDGVQDTMVRFEDYVSQNPEFVLDLGRVEIPTSPATGFEGELTYPDSSNDHIIQVSILALLADIKRFEKNVDLRTNKQAVDPGVLILKGQITAVRVVLESML